MRGSMKLHQRCLGLFSTILIWGIPASAHATFFARSHSVLFYEETQSVHFTVEFNLAPDFLSTDSVGRQADAFQFYIDGRKQFSAVHDGWEAIVRASELHASGDVLRIRDGRSDIGSNPDPVSGGWGPIRGEVPFSLVGNVFSFEVPLAYLSSASSDGLVDYELGTYEYGRTTSTFQGRAGFVASQNRSVPEPSTLILMSLGLLAIFALGRRASTESNEDAIDNHSSKDSLPPVLA